jgi:hypothetical protein
MPLEHGTSNATRNRNISEMIHAGHPPAQAEAASYRQQRADKAKAGHRRHSMSESSAHAPGHNISGEGDAVRQRHRMGEGHGTMKGESFGVGPIPGTHIAMNHGEHMPHDGVHLADEHRAGPPAIHMGDEMMHSSAHSHHGPHHHDHKHHHQHPKGTRPHHVDGMKTHHKKK